MTAPRSALVAVALESTVRPPGSQGCRGALVAPASESIHSCGVCALPARGWPCDFCVAALPTVCAIGRAPPPVADRAVWHYNCEVLCRPNPRDMIRLACRLALVMLLVAPVVFGPGFGGVLRLVAPQVEHHCACGMKPGTCGCDECARLEAELHADAADAKTKSHPVVKAGCDGDDEAAVRINALPLAGPPTRVSILAVARCKDDVLPLAVTDGSPRDRLRPPTPPPRS